MKSFKIISIILLPLFLFFISCSLEEPNLDKTPSKTGDQDFSKYVAIGNSLTAGYQSGSLVETHQKFSYPNLIAQQLDIKDFEQPTVSWPGIPNIMTLESLTGSIGNASGTGAPTNATLNRPYDNLGIPGIILADMLVATDVASSYSGSAAIPLVLREQGTTVLQQMQSLSPTLISCWIGNNDVLGYATSGGVSPSSPTSSGDFETAYTQLAMALAGTGADVVLANIPNVTSIPFFTTLPGIVLDANKNPVVDSTGSFIPLVGVNPTNSLVLLTAAAAMAQGYGIPVELGGTGQPLPDQYFLNAGEINTILTATAEFNQIISDLADTYDFALFDANEFFSSVVANGGFDPGEGLPVLTPSYISGGLFSLDGVHPSNLGYAVVANQFIEALNSQYDTEIQLVSYRDVIGRSSVTSTAKYDNTAPDLYKNTVELFSGSIK
jgi:lysophospholipase L1-like esterase